MLGFVVNLLAQVAHRSNIRESIKDGSSFVYAPGHNGPLMTVDNFYSWRKRFDVGDHVIHYSRDSINVNYVFVFTNPADMWWKWGRFKRSLLANQDELIVHNREAELALSRYLTHKFKLHLEEQV